MYQRKIIGVVIPAYNEERFIARVLNGVPEYVDHIYVINDGSQDNTGAIAEAIAAAKNRYIKVINHGQNQGVGKAIATGYKECVRDNVDVAVIMAGDNQMGSEKIPSLIEPILNDEAEYVGQDRLTGLKNIKGITPWRLTGNLFLKWLTRIAALNFSIADPQCGYTAIGRETLCHLDLDKIYPRYGYVNDLLVKLSAIKARIKYIQFPGQYADEKSKIRYWKYIPTVSFLLLRSFIWRISMLFQSNDIRIVTGEYDETPN
jgi:glycosyltransferase involved in cell wall biosynthesis